MGLTQEELEHIKEHQDSGFLDDEDIKLIDEHFEDEKQNN